MSAHNPARSSKPDNKPTLTACETESETESESESERENESRTETAGSTKEKSTHAQKFRRRAAQRLAARLSRGSDMTLIDTTIVDSGASGWYFRPDAPVSNIKRDAKKIRVGTATGEVQESAASCEMPLPGVPPGLFGHIMTKFKHSLVGIGNLCDKDCKVLFTKRTVVIYDKNDKPFLTG